MIRAASALRDAVAELPPIPFAAIVLPVALSPIAAAVAAFALLLGAIR